MPFLNTDNHPQSGTVVQREAAPLRGPDEKRLSKLRPLFRLSRYVPPPRLAFFLRKRRATEFTLLDVGCGNHSPRVTKQWFPRCVYYGVDRANHSNFGKESSLIDTFYSLDLNLSDLKEVPDRHFDVIVASHVIEHLDDGLGLLARLCEKLAAGGDMYVEFPSPKSTRLPSARNTLNFYDDPTHVRPFCADEVAAVLRRKGLQVVSCGRRRYKPYLFLTPLMVLGEVYTLLRYGKLEGPLLWDIVGFAEYVYAAKPAA